MTPKLRLILLLTVGLLVVLLLGVNLRNRYTLPDKLAHWHSQLNDQPPAVRIDAAQQILKHVHGDAQARLALATAYLESLRYGPAREALQILLTHDNESRVHAMMLMADSYLLEASHLAADATPTSSDLISERVETLLTEASTLQKSLATMPEAGAFPLLIQARMLDIRATLKQTQLRTLDVELSKAEAVDAESELHNVGLQLAEWRGQLDELNRQVETICNQALTRYPGDANPHVLLARRWLRQRDYGKVRGTLEQLAKHDGPIHRSVVGQVTLPYLDLEWTQGKSISEAELALIEKLVNHPQITGTITIDYRLVQTELAITHADWDKVLVQARETMRIFEGHPRAVCQYNLALAHMGKVSDALRSLAALNEKLRSGHARYIFGRLYLMDKQPKVAMEQFRQALDIQSDLYGPRLAIVQTMLDQGFVREAGNDIAALYRRNSQHPFAVRAYVRWLANTEDYQTLAQVLSQKLDPAGSGEGWRTPAMVAALLLDEQNVARKLAQEQLDLQPSDPLAHLIRGMEQPEPASVFQLAGMLAVVMRDMLDADPLNRLRTTATMHRISQLPTPIIARQRDPDADVLALAINPNLPPPAADGSSIPVVEAIDIQSLTLGRFVPHAYRVGLEMVEAALDLWPEQSTLRKQALALALLSDDEVSRNIHLQALIKASPDYLADHALQAVDACARLDWSAMRRHLSLWPMDNDGYPETLRIWLDLVSLSLDPDQSSQLGPTLRKALHDRPWCEPLLLTPLRATLLRRDLELTFGLLQDARQITPRLAQLSATRLGLATSRLQEAGSELELLLAKESTASELRMLAADLSVKVLLSTGRTEQAAGLLERLGLSCSYRRHEMNLAAADLLRQLGRTGTAISILSSTAAQQQIPPRWLDATLVRLVDVLPPQRSVSLMENLLQVQPGQWIVRAHLATAQIKAADLVSARETWNYLQRLGQNMPRVQGVEIQLLLAEQKLMEARFKLQELRQQGGRIAIDASLWLDELDHPEIAGSAGGVPQGSVP